MEIEESGSKNNEDESWGSPGIEKNTRKKGEIIFEFTRQQVIDQQKSREEIKDENATAENHAWVMDLCVLRRVKVGKVMLFTIRGIQNALLELFLFELSVWKLGEKSFLVFQNLIMIYFYKTE